MIGKIFRIRFCCSNPAGESWDHNTWKLFMPLNTTYIEESVNREPYAIEVNKGIIKTSFVVALIHGEPQFRKQPHRVEVWQKLTNF